MSKIEWTEADDLSPPRVCSSMTRRTERLHIKPVMSFVAKVMMIFRGLFATYQAWKFEHLQKPTMQNGISTRRIKHVKRK